MVYPLILYFSHETLTIIQKFGLMDKDKSIATIMWAIKQYTDGHILESVERRNVRFQT